MTRGRKFLRVELAPTTCSYLVCVACGRFNCDYAIVTDEPEAGIHKKCIAKVKAKREKASAT